MKEDSRTFGYDIKKDEEEIKLLRKWYTCSFCGRPSEVRPHAPLVSKDWMTWQIFPIRLCYYCAEIQDNIRNMILSIDKKDGN